MPCDNRIDCLSNIHLGKNYTQLAVPMSLQLPRPPTAFLQQVTLIVRDYDPALTFFVNGLGFDLIEDKLALTNDGRSKRWVIVRPPGGVTQTGLLLAQADGPEQEAIVGRQFAGRVGFFWRVDNFQETYSKLRNHGVQFLSEPRDETYGTVVVFVDIAGNKWDLLGPGSG
jgi:catechol 2,3-dioxygenase-like lactoylglutathione lyase family enzyme